jgi:pSer/pThr/pTyr-binding forkhead associated (FHA) protein
MPQGGQYDYQSQQPPPMMPGDGANAPAPRQSGAGGYANIPGYGGPGPSASPVAGVPQQSPAMGSQPPAEGQLYLIFNGRKTAITKEQFIIGRGSKTSDLPIKDGNISRKHAAIINHRGVYFIKDMGSTNGIEYNGMRIDNKRIEEGDVFHICDYEIRFTYR